MLGRVLGAACVQQFPHAVLHLDRVDALSDDVVLMEHMAEEVPVVELVDDLLLHLLRQRLDPVAVVAAQGDVQGEDVLDAAAVRLAVANGRAGDGKAVQEGLAPLLGAALEVGAAGAAAEVLGEEGAGLLQGVVGHPHQQVMLVTVAVLAHARRQVAGQQVHQRLDHLVGHPTQAETLEEAVDPALHGEGGRHPGGAEFVDH